MIHSKRKPMNRAHGARKFRNDSKKTHKRNIAQNPRRGGFRL